MLVQFSDELVATGGILAEDLGVLCGNLEISREFLRNGFNVDRCSWHFVNVERMRYSSHRGDAKGSQLW